MDFWKNLPWFKPDHCYQSNSANFIASVDYVKFEPIITDAQDF